MNICKRNIAGFTVMMLIWIIPMTYTGLSNKDFPGYPRTLCYIQRIAMLFTHSIESWPIYYIQVKPKNSGQWITIDENDYFKLKPFGYRTRLFSILYNSKDGLGFKKGNDRAQQRREEIAQWIAQRYSRDNSDIQLDHVRFAVAFYVPVEGKNIQGRWRLPKLDSFPNSQRLILSSHIIENK